MADPGPRQRRLLNLLPRIIAEQPKNSPVSVLIDTMAGALAELDEAMERTLRDHWLGLAQGQTPADEAMAVLERLGSYLSLVKNPDEKPEDYRLRLMRIDRVRLSPDGQTEFLLEDACRMALTALVNEAKNLLSGDLAQLAPDDQTGIRLALQDRWTRLAGKDRQLKDDSSAWAFPLPDAQDQIPQQAAEHWEILLTQHWLPILRRHWNELGSGDDSQSEASDALSRLGRLFGITRIKRRHKQTVATRDGYIDIIEIREEIEAFRQRIQRTAYILGNGLTSPKALLELTLTTLGAETCSQTLIDQDTVTAYGIPLGMRKRCTVCNSGAKGPCPNAKQWLLKASITDNPLVHQVWKPAAPLRPGGDPFRVANSSLVYAVPELQLKAAGNSTIHYPFLQNRDTGEIMLYAGEINPGEVLSLRPQVDPEECKPFMSHEGVNVYPWRRQYPSGLAVVTGTDGAVRDVSTKICFLTGTRFPDADVAPDATDAPRYAALDDAEGIRFADALNQGDAFGTAKFDDSHFGSSGQRVRMPRLRPGQDRWVYGIYTQEQVKGIVGNNPGELLENAPMQADDIPAEITFSWWRRPPALFRLTIPKNDWVVRADERGALDRLTGFIQKARAAGVTALISFPEPTQREHHPISDQAGLNLKHKQQEHHRLNESSLEWHGQLSYKETQALSEGTLSWRGVFDVTRLDGSHFD